MRRGRIHRQPVPHDTPTTPEAGTRASGTPTEPGPATAPAPPSDAEIRAWLTDHGWTDPSAHMAFWWNGDLLVATTTLAPDPDAAEPAVYICGIASQYLIAHDRPVQVQVLDQADAVLASRHGVSEQCIWRR